MKIETEFNNQQNQDEEKPVEKPVEKKRGLSPRFYDTPGDPSFSYLEETDEKE